MALITVPIAAVLGVIAFLVFKQPGQDDPTSGRAAGPSAAVMPASGALGQSAPPSAAGTASTIPPGYAWQRVFQEKEKDGWILLNEDTLRVPGITTGAVRLELAVNSDYCALLLREKHEIGAYQASVSSNGIALRFRPPSSVGKEVELAKYPPPTHPSSGTDRFEFRAFGATLTVLWNGVVVGTIEHDAIKTGGVGLYGRNARVRNVEVLQPEQGGAASPKPPSESGTLGQSAPPKPDPRYPVGQWVRPFQQATDIHQKWYDAGAKWENGWITPGAGINQSITLSAPNAQGHNWGARARIRCGGGFAGIVLRRNGTAASNTVSNYEFRVTQKGGAEFRRGQGRGSVSGADRKPLGDPFPIPLTEGQEVLIEAFAIGDTLYGRVEGRVFTMKTDGVLKEGSFEVATQIMPVRDIEFINLDGLSEAEAKKASGLE